MRVTIIAHPNSKKPKVKKDLLERLHVYVSEPPSKGKANKAIAKALAKHFKTKKSRVILISGAKSQNKVFDIIMN